MYTCSCIYTYIHRDIDSGDIIWYIYACIYIYTLIGIVSTRFSAIPFLATHRNASKKKHAHGQIFVFALLVLKLSSIKTGSTSHPWLAILTSTQLRVGRSLRIGVKQSDMEEVDMNIRRNVTTHQPFWTHRSLVYLRFGASAKTSPPHRGFTNLEMTWARSANVLWS